jgi:multidrug efflux pump subunit AcrA (membrane-fusion protein)
VKSVHKEVGEFVAPTDPVVMTVVQLDPLVATFAVPADQTGQLGLDREVEIRLGPDQTAVAGTIKFVSPGVDAQSGTVTVKAEFANPDRRYRSGERCVLILTGPTAKLTRHP